jgi:hypothetical protein
MATLESYDVALTVDENETEVDVVVSQSGLAGALIYSILGGDDAGLFVIDAVTGALRFVTAPDHEVAADADGDNVYRLEIGLSDADGVVETQSLAVTVANVNEGVHIVGNTGGFMGRSFYENTTLMDTIHAIDADGDPVHFTLSGYDADKFTIDQATGELRFLVAPDAEAPSGSRLPTVYYVDVTASDGVFSDTMKLVYGMMNVADAPTFVTPAAVSVVENQLDVVSLNARDDDGEHVTYAIVGGTDAALFTVDGWGYLRFIQTADYEAPGDADGDGVYSVTVAATDESGTTTQAMAVTVTNTAYGQITFTSDGGGENAAVAVAEGIALATTVHAENSEEAPINYRLSDFGDAQLFTIDATSGALRFKVAPEFHSAQGDPDNVYTVRVIAAAGNITSMAGPMRRCSGS